MIDTWQGYGYFARRGDDGVVNAVKAYYDGRSDTYIGEGVMFFGHTLAWLFPTEEEAIADAAVHGTWSQPVAP